MVKTDLSGNSESNGGSIYFKDPWYVDESNNQPDDFLPFSTPYSPTGNANETSGGVFLDQRYDIPNNPHYSVKAEAQQTFTVHDNVEVTGYFLGWEGDHVNFRTPNMDSSAVVFNAANAEARAVYKGHLASSVARATGYNNGRRLCKTNDGKLHLVYEDDNTIWYTYSTNNGQTWAKEYAISPRPYSQNLISHSFKNPSIATDGSRIYVVFEEVVQSNSATNHLIDFRKRENNSWRPIENISDGSWQGDWWNGPWSERPSISASGYGILIGWRDKTNGKIKMRYYNNNNWSSVRQIYANGYPEAICMVSETDYPLKLVFSENGQIKYISASYVNNSWIVSSVQNLSNYAPPMFGDHATPSASVDIYGYGYIAWEAMDQMMEEKHILYQKFNFTHYASSSSSVYSLALSTDSNLKNASLSYEQSSHYISVFFQDHDQIKRKRSSGSSWSLSSYGDGMYPNICPDKSVCAVWTKYTSAPYLLKTENFNGWLAKSSIAEVESFKRFYYPKSDSGYFTVDLKEFTANGQRLMFYQQLNSDTIALNGLSDFNYQLEVGENIEAGDLLSFWFVTDEQKYFLDEVQLNGDEAQSIIERSLSFDASQPVKGCVQIEFKEKEPFVINVVP
ncbi:MAG TPA: hypothetical protein ENL21_08200, partial [Caldithrix abyssi]|nr:hypothetical protein [Caldithrix abyssi]